jgi:hypothetical protein
MRILAAIHPPDTTTAMLVCLGLTSRARPAAGAETIDFTADPFPDWEPDPAYDSESWAHTHSPFATAASARSGQVRPEHLRELHRRPPPA